MTAAPTAAWVVEKGLCALPPRPVTLYLNENVCPHDRHHFRVLSTDVLHALHVLYCFLEFIFKFSTAAFDGNASRVQTAQILVPVGFRVLHVGQVSVCPCAGGPVLYSSPASVRRTFLNWLVPVKAYHQHQRCACVSTSRIAVREPAPPLRWRSWLQ